MNRYWDKNEKGWCLPTWIFLHSVADAYPDEPNEHDKKLMRQLFESVSFSLPCDTCNQHFQQELIEHPIEDENREALTQWLFKLHNRVNVRLGKPSLTLEEATAQQKQFRHVSWSKVIKDVTKKPSKTPLYLGAVLATVILFHLFTKKD